MKFVFFECVYSGWGKTGLVFPSVQNFELIQNCGSRGVSVQFVTYLSVVSQCGCVRHICGLWWAEQGMAGVGGCVCHPCTCSRWQLHWDSCLCSLWSMSWSTSWQWQWSCSLTTRQFKILVRIGAKLMEEAWGMCRIRRFVAWPLLSWTCL